METISLAFCRAILLLTVTKSLT